VRIAIVTTSYPRTPGDPAGHFVRGEARALRALSHEVVVIAPDAKPLGDGVDVIGPWGGGAFGWPGALERMRAHPLRSVGAGAFVLRASQALLRAGPFDRVIAHWAVPCAAPIALRAAGRARLEVVSHGGDVRLLLRMPRAARVRVVSRVAARAERWRFVSEHLLRMLSDATPEATALLSKIAAVEPCDIHVPDVSAAAAHIRAREGAPFAASVGRLVASKRVDRAVEVAAAEGMRLVVIGDGPERAGLERMARTRGADARFLGTLPREEALAWLGASSVLLFASRVEGYPTVLREAEALGVPVRWVG
jgi:glycosyltransferase involved in cell wall biosynthesis